ncbi:MAG: cysteine--tRNA ligase [Patescibacteria group bacterium]
MAIIPLLRKARYTRNMGFWEKIFRKAVLESQPLPTVRFFNTLTNQKEEFKPIKDGEVTMYNCGPTVYDFVHIGNLRSFLLADLLKRIFLERGLKVRQVINATDIGHLVTDGDAGEDKMTKALRRENKPITLEAMRELGGFYLSAFKKDLAELNVNTRDTIFPLASDHIPEQIALIQTLMEKGYGYKTSDGLYFDTTKFPAYGELGNKKQQQLEMGARLEKNPEKINLADFALWKFSQELGWNAPWGKGFPGWHIECSAMSMKYLGKHFDIHTGGIDLLGTHHPNEIAQSEAATNKKFVNYWLHNEFITIESRKISKSLGNTVTLKNIADRGFSPLAYRLWLLGAHYRSPINFTWEVLAGADKTLFRLKKLLVEELGAKTGKVDTNYAEKFALAISDDLDTPKALALLWDLVKDKNIANENKRATIIYFDRIFGLGLEDRAALSKEMKMSQLSPEKWSSAVKVLMDEREKARLERNFARADQIRQELAGKGYQIKDTPTGPELRIIRAVNRAKRV